MTSTSLATTAPSVGSADPSAQAERNTGGAGPQRQVFTFGRFHETLLDGPSRRQLVDDGEHEAALGRYLDHLLTPSIKAISIDVFDSVLVREPISELSRFVEIATAQAQTLGDRAFEGQLGPLDFLVARLQATHASYRLSEVRHGAREGSIIQIAQAMERMLGLRRTSHRDLIDCELDYEATVTYRHGPLCRWLEARRETGIELVLLSDMYLHGEHIRRLLDANEILPEVEVVSSADHKVNKHSGTAFPRLLNSLGLEPNELLHLGDSLGSDYRWPRRLGIRSGYLPIPRCERELIAADKERTLADLRGLGHDIGRWI